MTTAGTLVTARLDSTISSTYVTFLTLILSFLLINVFRNLLFFVIFLAFAVITLAKLVFFCKSVVCEISSNVLDACTKCDCCFVLVKYHCSVENAFGNSKSCLNYFPGTVFLKTRFLFTNLCEILLFLP